MDNIYIGVLDVTDLRSARGHDCVMLTLAWPGVDVTPMRFAGDCVKATALSAAKFGIAYAITFLHTS